MSENQAAPVALPNAAAALNAETTSQVSLATSLTIDSVEVYQMASECYLKPIKELAKKVEETFNPHIQRAHEAHKALVAERTKHLGPLAEAEKIVKGKMLTFHNEQERKRAAEAAEAERKAKAERDRIAREAAEAQRLADEEAARLRAAEAARAAAAKAEQDRIEREAREAAEAGNAAQAAALAAEAETQRQQDEAAAAVAAEQAAQVEEQGKATAEALQEVRTVVTAAPVSTQAASASGVSVRKKWVAKVTDKAAALKYIADNSSFHNLVEIDQSALNKLAGSLQKGLNIPGVLVEQAANLAQR